MIEVDLWVAFNDVLHWNVSGIVTSIFEGWKSETRTNKCGLPLFIRPVRVMFRVWLADNKK